MSVEKYEVECQDKSKSIACCAVFVVRTSSKGKKTYRFFLVSHNNHERPRVQTGHGSKS